MIQWVSHQILFLFSNISKPEYFRHCDRVLLFLHCDQPGPFCGLAVRVHVGTFRERGGGEQCPLSFKSLKHFFIPERRTISCAKKNRIFHYLNLAK